MMPAGEGSLSGKVGIVTGAGSGIGREVALRAVGEGATVNGFDVSASGLAETSALSGGLAGGFLEFRCDVSDERQVDDAIAGSVPNGVIDFLVNAAGIEDSGDGIAAMTVEHWDRLMGINLRGPFLTMRRVLPLMRKRSAGAVVNLGSIASLAGLTELPSYTAAKHGVVGLTKAAVAEYARDGIRINVVAPGPIDTPLQSRAEGNAKDSIEFRRRQEEAIPQGRYGTPLEVADLILFLIGDRSEYINGSVISIDGGMFATG
jgi:NAD(P)-dependent dehydrogenase (short-subunit alcohol dehydrogenase family)